MSKSKQTFEQLPDGRYKLIRVDNKIRDAIGLLAIGSALAIGGLVIYQFIQDDNGGWIMLAACAGCGGLLLIGGIWSLITAMMVRSKIHGAAIILDRWPLRLGEHFSVEYEQQAKRSFKIDRVVMKLVCEEWVRYRQGTDNKTAREEVHTQEVVLLEDGTVPANWRLAGAAELHIPAERMHSFSASDNRIEWKLHLQTEITSWPDYKAEFPVEVLPLLAPEGHP